MSQVKVLRKVTIKTCGHDRAAIQKLLADKDEGASIDLLKIAGETLEARTGQTDKGQFIRLLGDFLAENLTTGDRYTASQAILPSFIADSLAAALKNSQAVGFALALSARKDKTAIAGYVYEVRSLMPAEPTDRMKRLMQYAGIAPALPAA